MPSQAKKSAQQVIISFELMLTKLACERHLKEAWCELKKTSGVAPGWISKRLVKLRIKSATGQVPRMGLTTADASCEHYGG